MSTSTNPIVRFASFNLAVISLSCIGFSQTSQTAQTSEKKQLARAVVADTSCESEVRPIKRVNKLGKPIAESYSERQIFEAASSRLARELAAMEKTDEPAALKKILAILNEHAPKYYESTIAAAAAEAAETAEAAAAPA